MFYLAKINHMTEIITLKITNKRGLHARASAKFAAVAGEFVSEFLVSKDATVVGGTSIMGLMLLAAAIGDQIKVEITGADEGEALKAITALVEDKFGEEKEKLVHAG
jgi:phosphocarrier protein